MPPAGRADWQPAVAGLVIAHAAGAARGSAGRPASTFRESFVASLNVLWLIDHVCYDGNLHGGGRLFMNLAPAFDPGEVRIFPYFLRASPEVLQVFETAPLPVTNLAKGKYDLTTLWTLYRLCTRQRIDVLHLFCYASATFGRMVGTALRIPTVIHDFDTQIYFPYPLYLKTLDRILAGTTGHALAASPMCRDYMRDQRRVPGDRISIMPHAIPASRLRAAARLDRAAARASLGWQAEPVVFAAVTKLGPDRGNEALLRAFGAIAAARRDARLVIVHKPTYYHYIPEEYRGVPGIHDPSRMVRDLERLIADLGIAEQVDLIESLDQPDLYFAAADVLVAPFLHQRFSSVHLLEGFAHGRPAIATDLGEQRELIRDGQQGLLVPPGDEAALAQAMLRLAADEALRESMGRAAVALARRCCVAESARHLTSLYRSLAAGRAVEPVAAQGRA
jgi:glycosyltransferase involved in cell wall biosynthesis